MNQDMLMGRTKRTTKGISKTDFDKFFTAYLVAALWSSVDDNGESMDANYDITDIDPKSKKDAAADAKSFLEENAKLLEEAESKHKYDITDAGHDFWLTRNHHGTGAWDRGLGDIGRKLTNSAHIYGSSDLYVGDDGKLYFS